MRETLQIELSLQSTAGQNRTETQLGKTYTSAREAGTLTNAVNSGS